MNRIWIFIFILFFFCFACGTTMEKSNESETYEMVVLPDHFLRTKYRDCVDRKCKIRVSLIKDVGSALWNENEEVLMGVYVDKEIRTFGEYWGSLHPGDDSFSVSPNLVHIYIDGEELVLTEIEDANWPILTTTGALQRIVSGEKATIRVDFDEFLKEHLRVKVDHYESDFKNGDAERAFKEFIAVLK